MSIVIQMSAEERPKRVLSEDALAKLAVAREKALQVRRQQHADKLKAQVAKIEEQTTPVQEPVPEELPEEKPPEPKKKRALKPPADPVVVVEQSSDDEDSFDAPPGMIFVKRRRAKPKAEPPPTPSAEEMEFDYAYRRMVNGEFHIGTRR